MLICLWSMLLGQWGVNCFLGWGYDLTIANPFIVVPKSKESTEEILIDLGVILVSNRYHQSSPLTIWNTKKLREKGVRESETVSEMVKTFMITMRKLNIQSRLHHWEWPATQEFVDQPIVTNTDFIIEMTMPLNFSSSLPERQVSMFGFS